MRFPRASGILLHPTSLPGEFGIGDIGPQAFEFHWDMIRGIYASVADTAIVPMQDILGLGNERE